VQPGAGVVDAPVAGEGLHHVVVGLVRCDLADEQPIRTPARAGGGEARERDGIRRLLEGPTLGEDRHDHHVGEAGVDQFGGVVGRIGHHPGDERCEHLQLPATETGLLSERRQPALDERRRRDVVVVEKLSARMARDHIGRRAPDRALVEDPLAVVGEERQFGDRVDPTGAAGSDGRGVDLGHEAHLA
jgi:hypothetical protein